MTTQGDAHTRYRGAGLSGPQKALLIDALQSAYPTYDDLALMLETRLDRRLARYASDRHRQDLVLHHLITYAEAEGWTRELVTATAVDRPGNPEVASLVAGGFLDYATAVNAAWRDPSGAVRDLLPQASLLADGTGPRLERLFRPAAGFQDLVPFLSRLLVLGSRVCLVKVVSAAGGTAGTGFLAGPDLVLTNYHVLGKVIERRSSPSGVRCVFDYHIGSDGSVDHGVAVALADDWLVAASPPSEADLHAAATDLPGANELDYALVRLAEPVGRTRLPDGRERGWVDLVTDTADVAPGQPLLIVQHPAEQPMKLAVDPDGVLGVNANRTRLTYRVNTDHGSSGSPCFTFDLDLVALHHAGPDGANRGVPITTIVQHLRGRWPTR